MSVEPLHGQQNTLGVISYGAPSYAKLPLGVCLGPEDLFEIFLIFLLFHSGPPFCLLLVVSINLFLLGDKIPHTGDKESLNMCR